MSYLVLARKYRPQTLEEVIGQEHITELLKKAISGNRVAHAFLFCGPRGIGKTSCARILAKMLNCQEKDKGAKVEQNFFNELSQGTNFDVIEIDAASNRGIDEIRTLRENVKFAPSYGRYKIYIVDEVHMLTTEAFNALLKTLEEPPEHVKFVFATTEPHKVPATIISRCQRYDFKRIPLKTTVETLAAICKKENISVHQDALYAIAKASQGSFRDALSILDQIAAIGEREIKGEDVYSMLGIVEVDFQFELSAALSRKDCAAVLQSFDSVIDRGKDLKQLARDLVEHFRNLLVIKVGGKSLGRLVDYPVNVKEQYLSHCESFPVPEILKIIDALIEAQEVSRITESLRTPLEIAFAKICYPGEEQGKAVPAAAKPVMNVPPPVRPVAKPVVAPSYTPKQVLKDEKGRAAITPTPVVEDREEDVPPPTEEMEESAGVFEGADEPEDLDLVKIKNTWSALTFAVSREKMSLATYLQEGMPMEFAQGTLTIGFAKGLEFHKESLEHPEYLNLIHKIFSEQLKTPVRVQYILIGQETAKPPDADEPLVKSALEMFGGKIISKWHKE